MVDLSSTWTGLLGTLLIKKMIMMHIHTYTTMYELNGNYVPGALLNSLNTLLYLILTVLRGRCYYLNPQAQASDCLGSNPK